METSAIYYKLPSRTLLKQLDANKLGIIKDIKSRIIRKDAMKIVELRRLINIEEPTLEVALVCRRNICSKSIAYLSENDIEIIYIDDTENRSEKK